MQTTAKISIAAVFALGILAGCHHNDPESTRAQDFTPPGVETSMQRISRVQATKGAAADATLHDQHFDGNALNSTGRQKLCAIMEGTSINRKLIVYLDMPHDIAGTRQAAVSDYIKNAGVDDAAVQIVFGPNPGTSTPSSYNLAEIYKEEGSSYTGAAADATAATAAAAPNQSAASH